MSQEGNWAKSQIHTNTHDTRSETDLEGKKHIFLSLLDMLMHISDCAPVREKRARAFAKFLNIRMNLCCEIQFPGIFFGKLRGTDGYNFLFFFSAAPLSRRFEHKYFK